VSGVPIAIANGVVDIIQHLSDAKCPIFMCLWDS
jgi:hypothetical protein